AAARASTRTAIVMTSPRRGRARDVSMAAGTPAAASPGSTSPLSEDCVDITADSLTRSASRLWCVVGPALQHLRRLALALGVVVDVRRALGRQRERATGVGTDRGVVVDVDEHLEPLAGDDAPQRLPERRQNVKQEVERRHPRRAD